jgi:hypothetical protein
VTAPGTTAGSRDGDLGWTDADADGRTEARGAGVPPGLGATDATDAADVALGGGAALVDGVGNVVGRTGAGLVDRPGVAVGGATGCEDVVGWTT